MSDEKNMREHLRVMKIIGELNEKISLLNEKISLLNEKISLHGDIIDALIGSMENLGKMITVETWHQVNHLCVKCHHSTYSHDWGGSCSYCNYIQAGSCRT